MQLTPRKCQGSEGKTCNKFLPSLEKDFHGQVSSTDVLCEHHANWVIDEWILQSPIDRLAEQCEKKERKALSESSFSSFSALSSSLNVPKRKLSSFR